MQVTYNGTTYEVKIDIANERKYIKVYRQGESTAVFDAVLGVSVSLTRMKNYILYRLNKLTYEDKKPLFN